MSYSQMSTQEVQRLAKQGNKDALYEMAWRFELVEPDGSKSPYQEILAWKEYWFDKAAKAGDIYAKSILGDMLTDINLPITAENRQRAMNLYQEIVEDFTSNKLTGNENNIGREAQINLGIMLCEGFGTRRNVAEGIKLINAENQLKLSPGPDFLQRIRIGETYAQGYTQEGEEPSINDLEIAIQCFESAIARYNPERDNPRMLDFARQMLDVQKPRKADKIHRKDTSTNNPDAGERRKQMMETTTEDRQIIDDLFYALKRLKQRLAAQGW